MSGKPLILLLITVGWFWLCHYRYTCVHKQVCYGCAPDTSQITPDNNTKEALTFNANEASVLTTEQFTSTKDSILRGKSADNLLEITGYYYADEKAPEGYDNMGMARAAEAKALFEGDLPEESIRLISELKSGDAPEDGFAAVDFSWKVVDVEKSEVVKTKNSAKIYFPSNSYQKEIDDEIDAYLKQVADRVKASGEKVNLVGHTDDVGTPENNLELGRKRANYIRDILRANGVPAAQIITVTKGETKPITTNETEQGKYQNRRVELDIIKK